MRISEWSSDVCSSDLRSIDEPGFFGLNCCMMRANSSLAARSLAISMKKFMPMAQKNDSRPANAKTSRPELKDRKTDGEGKSRSVRVKQGGRRDSKQKQQSYYR